MAELTAKIISELPSAGTHTGTELLALSQSGASKKSTIADLVYPVGAIYLSVNSTNPSTLFGGTWEQINDRFLLSAGTTYSAGSTGGEATHTLTVQEMPTHNHAASYYQNGAAGSATQDFGGVRLGTIYADGYYVDNAGGGQSHNNMPPYLVVYMWKRVS